MSKILHLKFEDLPVSVKIRPYLRGKVSVKSVVFQTRRYSCFLH